MSKEPLIYVVDDEPLVRKALKQSLESLGVRVICFPAARWCLDAMASEPADIVITDMNMPEMGGMELLAEIRKMAPLVPVMIVTGYGSVAAAVKGMHLGAVDFVEKPLDEEILLPKVMALLGTARKEVQAEDLSRAEQRILELVAAGHANKEIAFLLNRSVRTVENHRHRLMKKLNVSSTAELVRVAITRKQQTGERK